jgi:repressor LexA
METSSGDNNLTQAQNELYAWIKDYMKNFQHSPSIRQMMQGMGLKSPAPIQSRLKHLQEKGYISWQEGKARTMQIVDEIIEGVPILGSVAAGGLIETYSDVQENLDISDVLKKKNVLLLQLMETL